MNSRREISSRFTNTKTAWCCFQSIGKRYEVGDWHLINSDQSLFSRSESEREKWRKQWSPCRRSFTGSPSSKYEQRRASALLRNILNIRIYLRKKTYRFCNLGKWKDFNKKQLTLSKMCVTSLVCGPWADLWPLNGLYCKRFSLSI